MKIRIRLEASKKLLPLSCGHYSNQWGKYYRNNPLISENRGMYMDCCTTLPQAFLTQVVTCISLKPTGGQIRFWQPKLTGSQNIYLYSYDEFSFFSVIPIYKSKRKLFFLSCGHCSNQWGMYHSVDAPISENRYVLCSTTLLRAFPTKLLYTIYCGLWKFASIII